MKSPPAALGSFSVERYLKRENNKDVPKGHYVFLHMAGRPKIFRATIDPAGRAANLRELANAEDLGAAAFAVVENCHYSGFWVTKEDGDKLTLDDLKSALLLVEHGMRHQLTVAAADVKGKRLIVPEYEPVNATLEITHPAGDPAAKGSKTNHFAYDKKSGMLTILCEARVAPTTLEDKIRWTIEPIADSHKGGTEVELGWTVSWPGKPLEGQGTSTAAFFTRLAKKNEAFGKKKITCTIDGTKIKREAEIMVFFPRDEKNNPEAVQPNWFYYWNQVCGDPNAVHESQVTKKPPDVYGFVPAMVFWGTTKQSKKRIVITDLVVKKAGKTREDAPDPTSGWEVTGIDNFANTIYHERHHTNQIENCDALVPHFLKDDKKLAKDKSDNPNGWSWGDDSKQRKDADGNTLDGNGNFYPDGEEVQEITDFGWRPADTTLPGSHPTMPYKQRPYYVEVDATDAENVPEDANKAKDWSAPGKQYFQKS